MRIELINTGTELLLGIVRNTHLEHIAGELDPLGLRIGRQVTVPDGEAILSALREAVFRSDVVIVTGGLGPTNDDRTRDAAAAVYSGGRLLRDEAILDGLRKWFAGRGLPINEHIARQAMVPEGACVLPNPAGTAPGLMFEARRGDRLPLLFLLPGPPRELHPMLRDHVLPRLSALAPGERGRRVTLRLTGVGESHVEEAVGERIEALPGMEVGYCARPGEVDVRLIGPAESVDEAVGFVREALGDFVFSDRDEPLESVVLEMLGDRGLTLAVAESCTGGLLAHRLTNVPGSSRVLQAGLTTYSDQSKDEFLDVGCSRIARHGAVSAEVARAMALGARRRTGSSLAVSTTGIAGPGGGTDGKPVGTVFIGLAGEGGEASAHHRRFRTDRMTFKQMASQTALDLVRRHVLGLPMDWR